MTGGEAGGGLSAIHVDGVSSTDSSVSMPMLSAAAMPILVTRASTCVSALVPVPCSLNDAAHRMSPGVLGAWAWASPKASSSVWLYSFK